MIHESRIFRKAQCNVIASKQEMNLVLRLLSVRIEKRIRLIFEENFINELLDWSLEVKLSYFMEV